MILHSDPYFKYVQMMMIPNEFRIFYSNVMGWNTTHQALLQVGQQAPSWGVQARKASRCSEWWLQLRNGSSLQVTHTHIYNSIIFRRLFRPTTLCKRSVPTVFLAARVTWPASKTLKNKSWDSVALKVSISSCFSRYSIRSGFLC